MGSYVVDGAMQKLLNHSTNGVVIFAPSGEILWLNDPFERMSGFLREEIIGRPLEMLFMSEGAFKGLTQFFAEEEEMGALFAGELTIQTKMREQRNLFIELLKLPSNEERQFALICEDRLEMDRLRTLLRKGAIVSGAISHVQSKYIQHGAAQPLQDLFYPLLRSARLVAKAKSLILAKPIDEVSFSLISSTKGWKGDLNINSLLTPHLHKAYLSQKPQIVETSSQEEINNLLLIPLTSHKGSFGILGIIDSLKPLTDELFSDLSPLIQSIGEILLVLEEEKERRNAEKQLQESQELLRGLSLRLMEQNSELVVAMEQALAAKSAQKKFLANMSHEMRTPLHSIMGFCELILQLGLPEKQRRFANKIYTSSESLLILINGLLDLSKIEAGKLIIKQEPCNLSEVIVEAISLMEKEIVEKGLSLHLYYPPDLPTEMFSDKERIKEVLLNLLSNALKFTDQGEINLFLREISRAAQSIKIEFALSDTGIGVDDSFRAEIFSDFSQADISSKKKHRGTGLGLAICRKIVEKMGGEINFESALGKGSTFYFSLPLLLNPEKEEPSATPGSGRRLLILSSDPVDQFILKRYGEALGFTCDLTEDVADYDLIIFDECVDRQSVIQDHRGAKLLMLEWEHLWNSNDEAVSLLRRPTTMLQLRKAIFKGI